MTGPLGDRDDAVLPAGGAAADRAPLYALLAAVGYLALVLFVMAPIRKSPFTDVLFPVRAVRTEIAALIEGDQRMVSGTIARNARALTSDPAATLGYGSCFPIARAFTLGEHLFGESLLGLLPWVVFRDPVLLTNAVVALSHWVAALSMYALVFGLTRASGAAFVAGVIFAFHPARLGNPAHPMVYGNLWTPLALLFAQRLFTRRRWRDALLLAIALALELLESFYQILGLTVLGGTYGLALALRFRRDLLALLPKIVSVAAVCAVVVSVVLLPYLETRSAWGIVQGRPLVLLFSPGDYLPGGSAGFGWLPSALAALGLLDRLRGPRGGPAGDPRLPFVVGALLVFWCSVYAIPLLGYGRLQSPLTLLAGIVPGLDAIRVPCAICFNLYLVVAVLAGYGVLAIASVATRVGLVRPVRAGLPVALAFGVAVEIFTPSLARAGYGWPLAFVPRPLAPPRAVAELYQRLPEGAVLDLPFRLDPRSRIRNMPLYVFLAGYHGRPIAGCANSFETPLQPAVAALAARLPDPGASDELYALGFRSIVVHGDLLDAGERWLAEGLLGDSTRARFVGEADGTTVLALASPNDVTGAIEAIVSDDVGESPLAPSRKDAAAKRPAKPNAANRPTPVAASAGTAASVEFPFWNRGRAIYGQTPPIEPSSLVVRWRDGAGGVAHEQKVRDLLPIALAAGARATQPIEVVAPPFAGDYVVEVALAANPDRVLSRAAVRVPAAPPPAPEAPTRSP